jgi:hypothetical protein
MSWAGRWLATILPDGSGGDAGSPSPGPGSLYSPRPTASRLMDAMLAPGGGGGAGPPPPATVPLHGLPLDVGPGLHASYGPDIFSIGPASPMYGAPLGGIAPSPATVEEGSVLSPEQARDLFMQTYHVVLFEEAAIFVKEKIGTDLVDLWNDAKKKSKLDLLPECVVNTESLSALVALDKVIHKVWNVQLTDEMAKFFFQDLRSVMDPDADTPNFYGWTYQELEFFCVEQNFLAFSVQNFDIFDE